MPTKQESLKEITYHLRNNIPVRVVRFNDGEWNAMVGHMGTNCDNHKYTEALKQDLRAAYGYLVGNSYISDYITERKAADEHLNLQDEYILPKNTVHHTFCAHEEDAPLGLADFWLTLRNNDSLKYFVGPRRLQVFPFLNNYSTIPVPLLDAYNNLPTILEPILRIARTTDRPIFVLACGFISCIIAQRIAEVNPNATILDVGSALDPLFIGPTRKTHMSMEQARSLYHGILFPPIQHYYQEIPGWMDFETLYNAIANQAQDGWQMVEVGSWMGKSAAYMCVELARQGKNVKFDLVDHFKGSKTELATTHAIAHSQNIRGLCCNNLRPFWLTNTNKHWNTRTDNLLRVLNVPSNEGTAYYADNSLDFVFIDAGHTYNEVVADINDWLPKVRPGGIIAGHDYTSKSWPEVAKAVNKVLTDVETIENCWLHVKQGN